MKFKLTFAMDNEAFGLGWDTEAARILALVAERVRRGDEYGNVMDINGNKVGSWEAR